MKYNSNKISEILRTERKKKGWSQTELIKRLNEKGVHVGRNTISEIESSADCDFTRLSLDLFTALAELYDCEIGYLLSEYSCKTGRNTDIQQATGLSDKAINGLEAIRQESENQKHNAAAARITPGYDDMEALNFLLENPGILSSILRGFQNLLHANYRIPVHMQNGKFVSPEKNNLYEYSQKVNGFPEFYYLLLARSEKDLNDNIPIAIDESFIQSIALKQIDDAFITLLKIHKEQ